MRKLGDNAKYDAVFDDLTKTPKTVLERSLLIQDDDPEITRRIRKELARRKRLKLKRYDSIS